jgi:predicted DNA-binding transcriptional regulator YafY
MKINRLLEITILLINRGTITAKELADRFEVSTRTIYRDIDVLSGTGVPVYTNKGSKGGICLLEDYALNKAIFNDNESDSLMLALKTLQATKYPQLDGILDKMGALFKNANRSDWVSIEFSQWGSGPNEDNKFVHIKNAILGQKIITFDYINAQGGKSARTVEPVQLVFMGQAWYLSAYCYSRKEFRTFRISRIKNLAVTSKTFQKRNRECPDKEGKADGKAAETPFTTFRLRFRPELLHRVYDDFDNDVITRNGDGTCEVTLSMPEDEWVYGYILSFGSHVEVLEPERLRNIIHDRLKKTISYYEKREI